MFNMSPRQSPLAYPIVAGCALLLVLLSACNSGPVTPPPELDFTGEVFGCSNVRVFRSSQDRTTYLALVAEEPTLGLQPGKPATFDLATERPGLKLRLDRFSRRPEHLGYCNTLEPSIPYPVTWKAIAGRVRIELTAYVAPHDVEMYRVDAQIEDAVFRGPAGELLTVPSATISDVHICMNCMWPI